MSFDALENPLLKGPSVRPSRTALQEPILALVQPSRPLGRVAPASAVPDHVHREVMLGDARARVDQGKVPHDLVVQLPVRGGR